MPASLAEIMRVPGVGPKRALQLNEKLGVATIDELEAALDDGRVARLGGFGAKTAAKIGSALVSHRRHRERIPIGEALPTAEQLLVDVLAMPEVALAEIVGSVRRRAETVGNIDLLVGADDADAASSALAELPAIEAVLEREPRASHSRCTTALTSTSDRAADAFAGALAFWTGNRDVSQALADRAGGRGYLLDASGLSQDTKPVRLDSEDEVFALLGLQVIPPEAREEAGIVACAAHRRAA